MNNTEPRVPHRWQRRFFTIWIGQAMSLTGSSLVQFALIWWLAETAQSATALATASLVAFLPNAFLAPFAGVVDRLGVQIWFITGEAVCLMLGLIATRSTPILQLEDPPTDNVTASAQPPVYPSPDPE